MNALLLASALLLPGQNCPGGVCPVPTASFSAGFAYSAPIGYWSGPALVPAPTYAVPARTSYRVVRRYVVSAPVVVGYGGASPLSVSMSPFATAPPPVVYSAPAPTYGYGATFSGGFTTSERTFSTFAAPAGNCAGGTCRAW